MAKRRRVARAEASVQEQLCEPEENPPAPAASRAYYAYTPPVDLEHAAEQPPGNLRMEIAVVRTVLADLLKIDLPPAQQALVVNQLMGALVRLVRENRFADGTQAEQLHQETAELLEDPQVGMAAALADTALMNGGAHGSNDH